MVTNRVVILTRVIDGVNLFKAFLRHFRHSSTLWLVSNFATAFRASLTRILNLISMESLVRSVRSVLSDQARLFFSTPRPILRERAEYSNIHAQMGTDR